MTKEGTQNITQQKAPGEMQSDVQLIATKVDFKPYLEAVNMASQRTRSIVYVLVAALLLIFAAYRNTTFPDWTDARLVRLQHASVCVQDNLVSDECTRSIDYANSFLFQGAFTEEVKGLRYGVALPPELKEQINAFIGQRTDALSLQLPFFGITIDMNDLGLVSGLLLTSILYVLYASLKSEIDNIEIAKEKALSIKDKEQQKDNLELLLMAQVLASRSRAKAQGGVRLGLYLLFLAVPIPHLFVVISDIKTFPIAVVLQGLKWARIETGFNILAFAVVVFCSYYLCWGQQKKLNQTLDDLKPPNNSLQPTPR